VPIPLYAPPLLRSSRDPNPFDQTVPRRPLRILVDRPLTSGQIDGAGDFRSYPTLGSGSTGYPDATAVLRSYLSHPALDVLFVADDLDEVGAVLFGETDPTSNGDVLSVEFRTPAGVTYTGIDHYMDALQEASRMAAKHQLDEPDSRAGVLFYRLGVELEADLVVTDREWLLEERGRRHGKNLANIVSPEESLAVVGLYLRWRNQPVIVGGASLSWHPTSMRHSAAFIAMPAFQRWNQAGRTWCDTNGDLTLESLNQACLTRISRAFKFRDNVFGLSSTMAEYEPEEMLCELDSLLYTLVGAFDVAARIVDHMLGLNSNSWTIGWQKTKSQGWQHKLKTPAAEALFNYTKHDSEMQRTSQVLRWLRNSVHNEALDLIRDDGAYMVKIPADTQGELRSFLQAGHLGWSADALGVRVQPPTGATATKWLSGTGHHSVTVRRAGAPKPADPLAGRLVLDVRRFVNKVFPATLAALDDIMQLTPLEKVPGYSIALEQPSRSNLPWWFSDTTGHRLRMLYGITELCDPAQTHSHSDA
jgi:hypothetical protein